MSKDSIIESPITAHFEGSVDPIIDEVSKLADAAIVKPTTRIMSTLESMWSLTFGNLDHWAAKKEIQRSSEIEKLKSDIFTKTAEIPEERKQEPKISVVGPALEASKYYFEESYYRELFSNLISRSMDSKFNNLIHPSFTEIIKQLSPYDAKLITQMKGAKSEFSVGTIRVMLTENHKTIPSAFSGLYLTEFLEIDGDYSKHSVAINNFVRLGLIEINMLSHFTDDKKYDHIRNIFIFKEAVRLFGVQSKFKVDLAKGMFQLTQFGKDFIQVCVE